MSDAANVSAMVMPMTAMARVRTTSRVRSAVSAMTAAEMAPAPCRQRPTITQPMSGAHAAMKLPSGEDDQAAVNHGLAPPSVGGPAERDLQQRLREAVRAERDADQRVAWRRPGSVSAYSANTGRMMNMPSRRSP